MPANARIRVVGGDPGPGDRRDRETAAVAVLEEQIRSRHGKSLVIYGAAHCYRATPTSFGTSADLAKTLEQTHPGRPRPVLIPLQRPPFRDLAAEEFLGGGMFSCVPPGGCRSAFAGSVLTLGQVADAAVYLRPEYRGIAPAKRQKIE